MSQPQESDHHSTSKTGSLLAPPSLRPRVKRAISGFEDFTDEATEARDTFGTPTETLLESPYHSRAASPIPSKHPSRSSSSKPVGRPTSSQSAYAKGSRGLSPDYGNELANSLSGLFGKSWTNLQSLASNVLGSDGKQELYKDKTQQRQRRPYEATHSKDRPPSAWGPRSREASQPGGGSKEERAAKVRAEKRKELLASSGSYGDARSKAKRRTSDDFESASAPPGEHDDRDALVFIHQVQKDDTLAGISIKYNTQMVVIKKWNRMWSNDGVQFRKTLMLPVDSCGIKGRPVGAPAEQTPDLLSDVESAVDEEDVKTPKATQGAFTALRSNSTSTIKPVIRPNMEQFGHRRQNSSQSGSFKDETPWKHDSWVLLEGHSRATEIARVPRRELGYFPRGRRKSVAYSDLDTPSTSLDLARASVAPSDSSPAARGHRSRRSSSANQWAQQMMGPGGVGKLNSKGVSVPGPALDKLNKTFNKQVGSSVESEGPVALQNIGGAIEGWVRNLSKTAAKLVEPPSASQQVRKQTGIDSGTGDLIELDNSFEIGEDELPDPSQFSDEEGRGRSRGSTMVTGLEDRSQLVRERAAHDASSRKAKGE
ncbi:hypothetical protein FH972_023707 [Carpinus fangiana]|uniref:LysM domain-containing protein n=1 Tax=Carpinus fangiana TaxID=176857 RepID=A0A5N6KVZ7_9ROSI|nr:hypothetical protein FH972_023707 [Carpinus fangiana]